MTAPSNKPFPFRLEFPPELPITARVEEITAAIGAHPVVILAGETGSGKTTQARIHRRVCSAVTSMQVPQFILEDCAERQAAKRASWW